MNAPWVSPVGRPGESGIRAQKGGELVGPAGQQRHERIERHAVREQEIHGVRVRVNRGFKQGGIHGGVRRNQRGGVELEPRAERVHVTGDSGGVRQRSGTGRQERDAGVGPRESLRGNLERVFPRVVPQSRICADRIQMGGQRLAPEADGEVQRRVSLPVARIDVGLPRHQLADARQIGGIESAVDPAVMMQHGLSVGVARVHIRARLEQRPDGGRHSVVRPRLLDREVQRGRSVAGGRVYAGAVVQQGLHDLPAAPLRGFVQRGAAVRIAGVDHGTPADQGRDEDFDAARMRRRVMIASRREGVQRGLSRVIRPRGIRAGSEHEFPWLDHHAVEGAVERFAVARPGGHFGLDRGQRVRRAQPGGKGRVGRQRLRPDEALELGEPRAGGVVGKTLLERDVQRGVAVGVGAVDIGPVLEQREHSGPVRAGHHCQQWRLARGVGRVHVGAVLEQHGQERELPAARGEQERGLPVFVAEVGDGRGPQRSFHEVTVADGRGEMERGGRAGGGVGTPFGEPQHRAGEIVPAIADRDFGGGFAVAVADLDARPGFEQFV